MKRHKQVNYNLLFFSMIILFSILRIYIGQYLPMWFFTDSLQDDLLMINYSHLYAHFMQWNILSLTKSMSYPLFLFLVNISGLSYKFILSLFWIVSSLVLTYAISKFLTKNKLILLFTFTFILFMPVAFDLWGGTRIYRNSIIAPSMLLLLGSLFIFINESISKDENIKSIIIWGIITGLIFTFNFYIKENGIITLPLLAISVLGILLFKIFVKIKSPQKSSFKNLIKIIIICLIPLLIFGAGTFAYKEANNYYFGISEINTRTGGEIGEFWSNLLKIDDEAKSTSIWVPASTIQKAWNASPTLQSRPDLYDYWIHSHWANGDMEANPLNGDIPLWSLREALSSAGLFDNEKEANDFFAKVNNELEQSFKNGTLKESNKIFISSSANGKTIKEIIGLKFLISEGIRATTLYTNISSVYYHSPNTSEEISNNITKDAENILNDKLTKSNESTGNYITEVLPNNLVKDIIYIYQLFAPFIVFISSLSFITSCIYQIKNKFKDRKINVVLGFNILILATFFVEIFTVSWFSIWINLITLYFYLVGGISLFAVFEVLSISCGFYILKENNVFEKIMEQIPLFKN